MEAKLICQTIHGNLFCTSHDFQMWLTTAQDIPLFHLMVHIPSFNEHQERIGIIRQNISPKYDNRWFPSLDMSSDTFVNVSWRCIVNPIRVSIVKDLAYYQTNTCLWHTASPPTFRPPLSKQLLLGGTWKLVPQLNLVFRPLPQYSLAT